MQRAMSNMWFGVIICKLVVDCFWQWNCSGK